jgi:excisionase family DNA binding protein
MTPNEWLTVEEASKFLKIHPRTLKRYIKSGRVKAYRLGRDLRFKRADLEAALEPVKPGAIRLPDDLPPTDSPLWDDAFNAAGEEGDDG